MKVLNEDEIKTLRKYLATVTFKRDADLFYKGHVPHAGHVLIDGEINLIRRSRPFHKLERGSVIGVHELINGIPFPLNVQVRPKTEVAILDKSSIQEILSGGDKKLQSILEGIIAK